MKTLSEALITLGETVIVVILLPMLVGAVVSLQFTTWQNVEEIRVILYNMEHEILPEIECVMSDNMDESVYYGESITEDWEGF